MTFFLSLFLESFRVESLAGAVIKGEDAGKSWLCPIRTAEARGVQPPHR